MKVRDDVLISDLVTFKSEGSVKKVVLVETIDELRQVIKEEPAFFILGKGSNTLISPDSEIQTFIKLSPTMFPVQVSDTILSVNAGHSVHQLMTFLQDFGLSGLEFSAGVPATLGGMVYMNFGCWGYSISELVERVHVMDHSGKDFWLSGSELDFGYRSSIFHRKDWIILEVELRCVTADSDVVKAAVRKNIAERLAKQPLRDCTFGSVFKNPEGFFAAKILDDLGFRGKLYNNSMKFSEKHANFLVNIGHTTFSDVDALIQMVTSIVKEKSGVQLDLEVRMVH